MLGLSRLKISLMTSAGVGGAYPGASLYLDFLSMTAPTFDSRITFSRGSNATVVDSTGRVTYAPANLLLRSQEFDNATWSKINTSVAANSATSPDGTSNADKLVEDTATSTHYVQQVAATAAVAHSYSVFVKAADRSFVLLWNPTVNFGRVFDVGSGTVSGTVAGVTQAPADITAVGNGWYRCSIYGTCSATTNLFRVYLMTDATTFTYTGDGTSGVYLWGAQLEQVTYQTTPSAYAATTSAAYYGPRFDYDPVTLAPRGLLIEEARTNLLLRSEEFDNASWTKTRSSITANATTSPDGTVDADKLVEDTTAAASHVMSQNIASHTSGVAYTMTVYAKAAERSQIRVNGDTAIGLSIPAIFDLSSGTVVSAGSFTASIQNAGNGWYRCVCTGTATATSAGAWVVGIAVAGNTSYTGDGTSGIYIWGAQLEAGAFATSYIPTVASTVTRSADVASMTGTNFSSWYNQSEGTFVAEADDPAVGNLYILDANNSTANEEIRLATSATSGAYLVFQGGAVQANIVIGTVAANTPFKIAGAYAANNANAAFNGAVSTTDTSFVSPTVNRLQIGASFTQYLNGHIREIVYFNTRQSNTRLQTLTAPPLVTTLSLDFTSGTYLVGY